MSPWKKRTLLLLFYALASLPWIVPAAIRGLTPSTNSPLDWVPSSFPPRQEYDRFREAFGSGDAVVMSWEGCTIDEPRLDRLTEVLREAAEFRDSKGNWYFEQVVSGREWFTALTHPPLDLDATAAARRLQGTLLGPDGLTTCVLVTFTPEGVQQRRKLVALLRQAARELAGADAERLHLAGPVIDGLAVDLAGQRSLQKLGPPSAILMLLVCLWCLRSVPAALLVFGVSVFGQAATLAMLNFAGESLNAITIVLPTLVQVAAIAGGIHLANYYFDAAREVGGEEAGRRAFRMGWLPCVLSAATTADGLASLVICDLTPVRSFAIFSAAGVILTAGLVLALVPGVLSLSGGKRNGACPSAASTTSSVVRSNGGWMLLNHFLRRYHAVFALTALALVIGAAFGVRHLSASVRIETLFPANSRILADYDWIEKHVGRLVPIEVVLDVAPDSTLSIERRIGLVRSIEAELAAMEATGGTLSALTFQPCLAEDVRLPEEFRTASIREWLAASREQLAGYLRETPQGQQWRVTAYVTARGTLDYGEYLEKVRRKIEPLIVDSSGRRLTGISLHCTGIMPLVHEIQRQLMSSLISSFLATLAMITAIMTLVQAGIVTGLIAVVSEVFPGLVLFGVMGWLDQPLDIGSVMTASVALGITVDDTLHYLTFFQRGLGLGMPRREAVRYAHEHCGAAMIESSVTVGLGLFVFVLSDFLPASRFAWMMMAQLVLALIGDLLFLPALLLGPLGAAFQRKTVPGTDCEATEPESDLAVARSVPHRQRIGSRTSSSV